MSSKEGAIMEVQAADEQAPSELRINEIDNENDFVPLTDSEEDNAENEVEDEADAEAFDDFDGHFDNPTETTTPVPVLKIHEPANALEGNEDFIAFSSSDEEQEKDTTKNNKAEEEKSDDISKEPDGDTKNNSNFTDFPWIVNHDHSKQREVADWLTLEIKDFVSYISPNRSEIESRNITIGKIRNAVKRIWPDSDLHVFGSYATDLYLPGSDIDCVVNSLNKDKDNRNSLYQLANYLNKNGLAIDVEVISKARVPIIKFVEPESLIHIDVSFERTNGVDAAKLIRGWLDSTSGLRELVLIVKQFLYARKLNNVHTGGLGGFSIICLVYTFLHMHPRIITGEILPLDNIGVLLIDFFELYGKNFGYDDVAISVLDGVPNYLPKDSWKEIHPIRNPFSLAIQDPGDATNNISRGSFNIRDIKKAFAGAFDLLTNRCFEVDELTFKNRHGISILGNVIKYRGKQRDFKDERKLVVNKAIIENEEFHKKRSRIIHDVDSESTVYVDDEDGSSKEPSPSDTNIENEVDAYNLDQPLKKKQKKDKRKKKKQKNNKPKRGEINDDADDSYNPLAR